MIRFNWFAVVSAEPLHGKAWSVGQLLKSSKPLLRIVPTPFMPTRTIKCNNRVRLLDLVEINAVKFNPNKDMQPDAIYQYVEIKHIGNDSGIIGPVEQTRGENLKARAKNVAHANDVLLSLLRPENRMVAVVPEDLDSSIVSNSFAVLSAKQISAELLFFILRSEKMTQLLSEKSKGLAVPTINLRDVKEVFSGFNIHLDPLNDSKAKSLFAQWCDSHRRATSLTDAIDSVMEDTLVGQCRQTMEGAPESAVTIAMISTADLGDRWDLEYQLTRLSKPAVSWNYPLRKLSELVRFVNSGAMPKDGKHSIQGRLIRQSDHDEKGIWAKPESVIVKELVLTGNEKVQFNDLMLSKAGLGTGSVSLIPKELEGAWTNQHLMILRSNDLILPEFLCWFFKSKWGKMQLQPVIQRGTSQPFLVSSELGNIDIPVPGIEIQTQIVAEIHQMSQSVDIGPIVREIGELLHSVIEE